MDKLVKYGSKVVKYGLVLASGAEIKDLIDDVIENPQPQLPQIKYVPVTHQPNIQQTADDDHVEMLILCAVILALFCVAVIFKLTIEVIKCKRSNLELKRSRFPLTISGNSVV